jgi:thiol-disulfide isomerase/thioredoxin
VTVLRCWLPCLLLLLTLSSGCKNTRFDRNREPIPPYPGSRPGNNNWKNERDGGKPVPPPEDFGTMEPQGKPTSRGISRDIISGSVVDEFSSRNVPNAYLEVTPASDPRAKPIGFRCDRDGQFQIEGLTASKAYLINVRAEVDGRVMGGMLQVRAPASRGVIIRVSEDRVNSLTPASIPGLGDSNPFINPDKNGPPASRPSGGDPITGDNSSSGWKGFNNTAPPPTSKPSGNISTTAEGPATGLIPPAANIPSSPPPPKKETPRPITGSDPELQTSIRSGGTTVEPAKNSFTLRGLNGPDWQLSTASGKLILLDFWSPNCPPCMKALPEVKKIASTHGAQGLEVVGLVCDMGESSDEYLNQARDVAKKQNFNYAIYTEPKRSLIKSQFQVKGLPTMVLIDRQGTVVWKGVGATPENLNQLEKVLKEKLR